MNERDIGAWGKDATAAVMWPYPNIGGVADIAQGETDFLNTHGFKATGVHPRLLESNPRWRNPHSMSMGFDHPADHGKYGTEAHYGVTDVKDFLIELPKYLYLSGVRYLVINETALYASAYGTLALRALRQKVGDKDMVTFALQHANTTRENVERFKIGDTLSYYINAIDLGFVNTPQMQQLYESVLRTEFMVLPNPVNVKKFTPFPRGPRLDSIEDINLRDGKTNIVYVGRLEKRKGLNTALTAISLLVHDEKSPKDFRFIIAGSGPDEAKLRHQSINLGLRNYVHFIGTISEEKKPMIYRSADFCYFPSESDESFGNVLLEAWASGVPVLAGQAYSSSLVKDHENGFRLKSTDPAEAACMLEIMIRNPQMIKQFGLQASKFAQQFDSEQIFEKRLAIAHRIHAQKVDKHQKQRTTSYPTL